MKNALYILILTLLTSCYENNFLVGHDIQKAYPMFTVSKYNIDCHFYNMDTDQTIWSETKIDHKLLDQIVNPFKESGDFTLVKENEFILKIDNYPYHLYYFPEDKILLIGTKWSLSQEYISKYKQARKE